MLWPLHASVIYSTRVSSDSHTRGTSTCGYLHARVPTRERACVLRARARSLHSRCLFKRLYTRQSQHMQFTTRNTLVHVIRRTWKHYAQTQQCSGRKERKVPGLVWSNLAFVLPYPLPFPLSAALPSSCIINELFTIQVRKCWRFRISSHALPFVAAVDHPLLWKKCSSIPRVYTRNNMCVCVHPHSWVQSHLPACTIAPTRMWRAVHTRAKCWSLTCHTRVTRVLHVCRTRVSVKLPLSCTVARVLR